jgi:hypothetical protein
MSLNNKIEHEDLKKEHHTEGNSAAGTNKARFSQPYYSWATALSSLGCGTARKGDRHWEENLGLGRAKGNQTGGR